MLKFNSPLIEARLVKRYKRFLADVILKDGQQITVHCPNTGAMTSCMREGATIYLSDSHNDKRKYRYTWEYTKTSKGYIGINTQRPNNIFEHWLLNAQVLPKLFQYDTYKREARYGENSKIDFLLKSKSKCRHYVEVKNCTYYEKSDKKLYFPDAKSDRATKHVRELAEIAKKKDHQATIVLLVNRPEGVSVSPASQIDPTFAAAMIEAKENGVNIVALRVKNTLKGSLITDSIKVVL